MNRNYPKIVIKDASSLRGAIEYKLSTLKNKNNPFSIDQKTLDQQLHDYIEAWKKYEDKIIRSMCEIYDLEFAQNIIHVYITSGFDAISSPLVIDTKYSPG